MSFQIYRLVCMGLLSISLTLCLPNNRMQAAEKPEFYEQVYLSEANALKQIMGDLKLEKHHRIISAEQKKIIQKRLRRKLPEDSFNYWAGLRNGKVERYALILDEEGKHFPITFIVGLTPQAKISEVAVMVYRERRGDGVKRSRFLNQFKGKSGKDPLEINTDIIHLTGSTISSWSIAAGVRKALILLEEVVLK
ncbi:MAG: FMN-binding protein [Candidatus Sericytochromatia bacterium]|nr:FMN-binding protein [Candidatus Sericytochromatia bacterium]